MFQEIFRAPFVAQASLDMFRSPDVARLPFVNVLERRYKESQQKRKTRM